MGRRQIRHPIDKRCFHIEFRNLHIEIDILNCAGNAYLCRHLARKFMCAAWRIVGKPTARIRRGCSDQDQTPAHSRSIGMDTIAREERIVRPETARDLCANSGALSRTRPFIFDPSATPLEIA